MRLKGKRILLGVSGGIAAYKSCDLASRLVKEGAVVTAILTKGARKFVTPYAFEALTGQPCLTRLFQRIAPGENPYPHIEPAREANLAVIAPATADLMAKLAHGLADELLPTLMLTVHCPVVICPSMNVQMWQHPATQANVKTLRSYGHTFVGPDSGSLACGDTGAGRMSEPAVIVDAIVDRLKPSRK
ncbi:MAG TPA: flavoprotein [Planctomycetota bacterium]|nr:flavoprotein [Planctomycetota bacterium]